MFDTNTRVRTSKKTIFTQISTSLFTVAILFFHGCTADKAEVANLCDGGYWEVFNVHQIEKGLLPVTEKWVAEKDRNGKLKDLKTKFKNMVGEFAEKVGAGKEHHALEKAEALVELAIDYYVNKQGYKEIGDKDDWEGVTPEDMRIMCWKAMHHSVWTELWNASGKDGTVKTKLGITNHKDKLTLVALLTALADKAEDNDDFDTSRKAQAAAMCAMCTKHALAIIEGLTGNEGDRLSGVGLGGHFYKGRGKNAGADSSAEKAWKLTAAKYFGVVGGKSGAGVEIQKVMVASKGKFGLDADSLTRKKYFCGWLWPLLVILCGCSNCLCLICHLFRSSGRRDYDDDSSWA